MEKWEHLHTDWCNRKMVQLLWKTVWQFLKKLKWNYHVIQQVHF